MLFLINIVRKHLVSFLIIWIVFCIPAIVVSASEKSSGSVKTQLSLTQEEQAWLKDHPVIRVGADSEWAPMEFLSGDGNYKGIAIDYLKKIELMLNGVRFEFVHTNWQELIARAKKQQLDIFTCVARTPERDEFLLFTEPYIHIAAGIFVREDAAYIADLNMMPGKRIAVVEGYVIHDYLAANYPDMDLILVKNPEEGVRYILEKKAFAYIDNIITTGHLLSRQGYLSIKLAGGVPFINAQSIGVRKDWPQLRNILQKAINTIPDGERDAIFSKWGTITFKKTMDYSLFWKIGGGGICVICLILFWNRRLKSEVERKTAEIKEREAELRSTSELLEKIFSNTHFSVVYLDTEFNFIRVNHAYANACGYPQDYFVGKNHFDLYPHEENKAIFQKVVTTCEPFTTFAKPFENPDHPEWGVSYWDWTLHPIKNVDNTVEGLLFVLLNVTEAKRAELELRRSEEQYRTMIESSREVIFSKDLEGRYHSLNLNTAIGLGGTSIEGVTGKTDFDLLPKDQAAALREKDMEVMKSGAPIEVEEVVTDSQGQTRIYLSRKWPAYDAQGELTGIGCFATDITARKQAEEKLRKSEKRLKLALEGTVTGLWDFYPQNGEMYFSPSWFSMLGYEPDEFPHEYETWMSLLHQNDRRQTEDKVNQFIENKRSYFEFEYRMRIKKGGWRWILVKGNTVEIDEVGSISRIIGTHSDITERKESEQETARLASLIHQSNDDIIITDIEGNIQYVNPAFERITGYKLSEVKGHNPRILKSGKHDMVFYKDIWDTIKDGRAWMGNLINKCKDGSLIEENCTIFPVLDKAGIVINYAAVKRDVTAQKLMEVQLHQAQKMEAIGTLAGGIAHDFNNILAAILGYTELAQSDIDNQETLRKDLDEIYRGAERAKELVRQILTFSRKTVKEKNPLKVALVVKEALKLLRSSIPTTIEIKQDISSKALVLADPTQIHQLVMNLCTNAYHAMRESGGTLAVTLQEVEISKAGSIPGVDLAAGMYLQLEICDTGTGMNEETRSKIFEPYYTTKGIGEGTGLGLAVVHGIVQDSGGRIYVDSEPDQGTRFHIYLPVYEGKRPAVSPQRREVSIKGGHETIMLVDDDVNIVEIARRSLQEQGYNVHTFTNGVQAFQEFQSHPDIYDLIFTDMTMPYMTGSELSQKALEIRPNLPIILCSGHSELINRKSAKAMGINEYCEKPLNIQQMLQTVRKVLDNAKCHTSSEG